MASPAFDSLVFCDGLGETATGITRLLSGPAPHGIPVGSNRAELLKKNKELVQTAKICHYTVGGGHPGQGVYICTYGTDLRWHPYLSFFLESISLAG